ncbi:MAG TPA: PAS domain S-box protein [Burkholderiales bacterium]
MHNPSQLVPLQSDDPQAFAARDIAALVRLSLQWTGKSPLLLAQSAVAALDAALAPAVVLVRFEADAAGQPVTAIETRLPGEPVIGKEEWRRLFAAWLDAEPADGLLTHPHLATKLRARVAPIGTAERGFVAVASADARFPREREGLFLDVAAAQLALLLDQAAARAPAGMPEEPDARATTRSAKPAQLRLIADALPAFIVYLDSDLIYRFVNRPYADWIGRPPAEIVGRRLADVLGPERYARARASIARALAGERTRYETEVDAPGGRRLLHGDYVPDRDASGRVRGIFALVQDVTERKELEEERARALQAEREARAQAELLRDLGTDLNSKLDLQTLLQRVTDAATAAIGAEFGTFLYKPADARGESYEARALAGAPRELLERPHVPSDIPFFGPGGGETMVRCDDVTRDPRYARESPFGSEASAHGPVRSYLAAPVRLRSGELVGGLFFGHRDAGRFEARHESLIAGIAAQAAVAIENVRLLEAVREHARRVQATYDHAPVGIAEADASGRFLRVNDRFCAITGYSREELLARTIADITHPEDLAAAEAPFHELLAGERDVYTLEKRYVRKNGDVVWVRLTASAARDAQARPEYAIGVIEDITERRRSDIVIAGQRRALEQIARGESLGTVLETLIDTFQRQSGARAHAAVSVLDAANRVLQPLAVGDLPPAWIEELRRIAAAGEGMPGAAALVGECAFSADLEHETRWPEYRAAALRVGFRAAWSRCLRGRDGTALGTLDVVYRDARAPSADESHFVDLLTETAAVAIERSRNEAALRFQAQILGRVHDAVVMIDAGGRIVQWNEGAARIFGFSAADALGRHVSALCAAPEDYRWLDEHIFAPLKRRGRLEVTAPLKRRSGEVLHALLSLSLLTEDDGHSSTMVAYVLDITERVRAERELAIRVRQQEAVARLGQRALARLDLQTFMDETALGVAETLGVEFCTVLELDADGAEFVLRAGVGWSEGLVGAARVSAGLDTQAGYALHMRQPVIVADLSKETRFSAPALLREHGVVSGISVIVPGEGDRAYGVIGAHTTRRRAFSAHDVNFLQAVAHLLAGAIQRHRFERALAQARDELERRVEERTAELARANQSLRDEVVERMGVESALRESEAQYRMLFERNPVPAWVFDIHTRHILAANETAVWQYGYTREEFLRMNIHELHPPEEASRALDYTEQFPPETAYVGVWKHRKQDETVIDVEIFVYEVLFQGRWARLMLANDITERRRAEREFRLLETITRSVSEARDLDSALYSILRHICEATGWVYGEAWLPTAGGERLRCSRAWYYATEGLEGFRHAAWDLELQRGEDLIGRAWEARQPVWMPDVADDASFRRVGAARAAGLRAGIAFPVVAENEVVALLAFFLRESRIEDEHQVKLVATIATQAGLAVQRKRAEELLRESEERFRLLVEGAHDYAIFMLDPLGRVASWNKGAERLEGYAAEEIIGKPLATFYTQEEVAAGVPQQVLEQARTAGVYEGEGWRVRKDGERFWASVTVTALHDASRGLRGFVKVTRDVTERKQAEERLKESEARLARAQEFSLLMVAHVGLDGRWLKVPQMLCATLAYREEELLARGIMDVTHPDDFAPEWDECARLICGEAKSFDIEKRFLRRDGKVIWVYQNTSIVLDDHDRPVHFLTFIRDITQRKEAEEQLRRSRIQLSEAQRLAHLGSWELDVASSRMEWSDELYRIYGVPRETPITYASYLGYVHPEDRERVKATVARALESREPFTLEERVMRADGEVRHLLSHGAVVTGPRGEVARLVGVCLDITERKRAEQRLREYAHRLESLSQRLLEAQETERRRIARELHDQIGQDLSVIKINLQALKRLPGATAFGGHLDETVRIVEGVLATARNLSVELRPSMLDDLGLAAALRWYLDRQAQRAGVALHFAVDSFELRLAPAIETACFRLAQEALTNILRHAEARHVDVTLRACGQELEMRIMDDGRGFDVEAARMRASRGESFGLLGMEERALLAGGRLEILSAPGEGTQVVARFPLTLRSVQDV